MRTALAWIGVGVGALHGLLHLLGAAKGLGWVDAQQLDEPIGTTMGVLWLLSALAVLGAVGLLAAGVRRWWLAVAVAAVASQLVILTSWTDAKGGTLVNVVLLTAAVYGFAAHGPLSLRADYQRQTTAALTRRIDHAVLTEADLARLPEPGAKVFLSHCAARSSHPLGPIWPSAFRQCDRWPSRRPAKL